MIKFFKCLIKQYVVAICFLTLGTVIGATLSFQVTKEIVIMGNDICIDELRRMYGHIKPKQPNNMEKF